LTLTKKRPHLSRRVDAKATVLQIGAEKTAFGGFVGEPVNGPKAQIGPETNHAADEELRGEDAMSSKTERAFGSTKTHSFLN
jgi:hypothetical protein